MDAVVPRADQPSDMPLDTNAGHQRAEQLGSLVDAAMVAMNSSAAAAHVQGLGDLQLQTSMQSSVHYQLAAYSQVNGRVGVLDTIRTVLAAMAERPTEGLEQLRGFRTLVNLSLQSATDRAAVRCRTRADEAGAVITPDPALSGMIISY
jgi:hypothetical protein